jgi:hypothetical protein
MTLDAQLADDVAAASAAYLFNVLPSIVALPPPEAFERLKGHFEAALAAYADGTDGWIPEPSDN